jgi:pimeloyl-ACP methyl ester carboxylesterase
MEAGSIPFMDFGGSGPSLHFLHANGYPPACYAPLLGHLATIYHTFGMLLRPLWPAADPMGIRDWCPFSDDLLQFLGERQTGTVIGMGHSIGAIVTLRAALVEPNRFGALVLLDPVLLPPLVILEWSLARFFGARQRSHPRIEAAMKRRRHFDDLEQMFAGYRRRDLFRFVSDEHLRLLIEGMTWREAGAGYELAYSPEWEARIYYTGIWRDWDLWRGIRRLRIPTLVIRGAETDIFWETTARAVGERNTKIRIVTLENSTHLLPLERPLEVFDVMHSFLQEVL